MLRVLVSTGVGSYIVVLCFLQRGRTESCDIIDDRPLQHRVKLENTASKPLVRPRRRLVVYSSCPLAQGAVKRTFEPEPHRPEKQDPSIGVIPVVHSIGQ